MALMMLVCILKGNVGVGDKGGGCGTGDGCYLVVY